MLVAGDDLDPKKFFKKGNPVVQGSSFDLTIGCIIDHEGNKVESGLFTIKPGHMVQVVSSEEFDLSESVTGHVTYKTTLTRKGIWALTVGIVDPGWKCPISTTLLNFSRVDHAISVGDAFLRVSFFEHASVPQEKMRKAPSLESYMIDVQKTASTLFPVTFLNTTEISEAAGKHVLSRIREQALAWVAGIAILFTILQAVAFRYTAPPSTDMTKEYVASLRSEIKELQQSVEKLERARSSDAQNKTRR